MTCETKCLSKYIIQKIRTSNAALLDMRCWSLTIPTCSTRCLFFEPEIFCKVVCLDPIGLGISARRSRYKLITSFGDNWYHRSSENQAHSIGKLYHRIFASRMKLAKMLTKRRQRDSSKFFILKWQMKIRANDRYSFFGYNRSIEWVEMSLLAETKACFYFSEVWI